MSEDGKIIPFRMVEDQSKPLSLMEMMTAFMQEVKDEKYEGVLLIGLRNITADEPERVNYRARGLTYIQELGVLEAVKIDLSQRYEDV